MRVQLSSVFAYNAHDYWVTRTSRALHAGQRVTLSLSFSGRLDNDHIVGFYKTTYDDNSTALSRSLITHTPHPGAWAAPRF